MLDVMYEIPTRRKRQGVRVNEDVIVSPRKDRSWINEVRAEIAYAIDKPPS